MDEWVELLDAHDGDGRLAIALRRSSLPRFVDARCVDVRLTVVAWPLEAVIDEVWFAEDIEQLAAALDAVANGSEAALAVAGGRALELRLGGGDTSVDEEGTASVEATICGLSADAPNFELTWWPSAATTALAYAADRARRFVADLT